MRSESKDEVTRLLGSLAEGRANVSDELLPIVYQELRRLAAWRMARERPGQTLQATALVHEAWLRLVSSEHQHWENRSHFFNAAAEAMRRILVENARRKKQVKRGGRWQRVDFDGVDLPTVPPDEKVLLVDEVLEELSAAAPVEAQITKLHYFMGLSHAETGELLGLSERTVKRRWAYAKAWLLQRIREKQEA